MDFSSTSLISFTILFTALFLTITGLISGYIYFKLGTRLTIVQTGFRPKNIILLKIQPINGSLFFFIRFSHHFAYFQAYLRHFSLILSFIHLSLPSSLSLLVLILLLLPNGGCASGTGRTTEHLPGSGGAALQQHR